MIAPDLPDVAERRFTRPEGCGRLWSSAYGKLTESEHQYALALLELQTMSVDELALAVLELDQHTLRALARGPVRRRYDCGVCEAFGSTQLFKDVGWTLDDPRVRVFAYHELPKARMHHTNDQHYGELANETYRRTLAVYYAASWDGMTRWGAKAEPPNA